MPLKTFQDEQPTLNLTPMIDIVFLLIIFFMVGTKFAELEQTVPLEVPSVGEVGALTPAPEKRIINVYNDGSIVLDRQTMSIDELKTKLTTATEQYPNLGIIVRGDAQGAFQNVASVLSACRHSGIDDMAISVRLTR
ncbi:MAG: biopolymer transporter ExbD [Pirellulaceae bacterium]|nr:biopolymer transporter ExbD [Pirellulaceae bacterium]